MEQIGVTEPAGDGRIDDTVSDVLPPFPPCENGESSPTLESRHGVVVEAPVEAYVRTPELIRLPTESPQSSLPQKQKTKRKGRAEDLRHWNPPSDWRVERRVRTTGSTAGMVDTYYYEPVTSRQFRSKREVFDYMSGKDPKKSRGKAKNKETKDYLLPSGSSNLNNEETEVNTVPIEITNLKNEDTSLCNMPLESSNSKDKANSVAVSNFNFETPTKKVKHGVTNSAIGSWSPFVGGEMVPESVKREWAEAFASLSRRNGG